MKPCFLPPLVLLLAAVPGCKPAPDPVIQHMRKVDTWTADFRKLYPSPLAGLENPPTLSLIGEVGPTASLSFMLLDFPKDSLPELEKWLRGRMSASGIQEVRLSCMLPITGSLLVEKLAEINRLAGNISKDSVVISEQMPDASTFRGMVIRRTVILHADGRRDERKGEDPPKPTFMGRPLPGNPSAAARP